MMLNKKNKIIKMIDAKLQAFLLSFFTSTNIGIKTLLKDPSAKIFLSIFGNVNATKNAWAMGPDPKKKARNISLKKPKTLLRKVQALTIEKFFINVLSDI